MTFHHDIKKRANGIPTPKTLTEDDLFLAQGSPAGFAYVTSGGKLKPAKHVVSISEKLVDVAAGRINRLMIFLPPRHGKSTYASTYFPAWYLGRYPDNKIILGSYEANFAAGFGRKARDLVDDWGKPIFNVEVSKNSASASAWTLQDHEGGMWTAGVGGPMTGKGAHVLIIDDPVKNAEDARSETQREKNWDWYQSVAYTRLEADPEGSIVLMLTRWHADDLAGRILKESESSGGDHWDILSLPAIAMERDPLGRMPGEALWPERIPIERLKNIKSTMSDYWFSAMFQQDPQLGEGNMFKVEWINDNRYSENELPPMLFKVQTVDSAWKEGVSNDYSVIATWGTDGKNYYLLDLWRKRVSFPDLCQAIVDEYNKQTPKPNAIVIEESAAGAAALPALYRYTRLPVIAFKPEGSKINRADAVLSYFKIGKVKMPRNAEYMADWKYEHCGFPVVDHDDTVDTTTMALLFMVENAGEVVYLPSIFDLDHTRLERFYNPQQAKRLPGQLDVDNVFDMFKG